MSAIHRTKEWQRLVRVMKPRLKALIDQGYGVCVDCRKQVVPDQTWEVGHILPASRYPELAYDMDNVGISHKKCNRDAGSRLGAETTNARKRTNWNEENGLPNV